MRKMRKTRLPSLIRIRKNHMPTLLRRRNGIHLTGQRILAQPTILQALKHRNRQPGTDRRRRDTQRTPNGRTATTPSIRTLNVNHRNTGTRNQVSVEAFNLTFFLILA